MSTQPIQRRNYSSQVEVALQQQSSVNLSYLSQVEKSLKGKNYTAAFDDLVFFFMGLDSNESDKELKRAYNYLLEILPHLDERGIRALYGKIFPQLQLFPLLTEQQLDLALALASWYINKPCKLEEKLEKSYLQAMHYYAKAIAIAEAYHQEQLFQLHQLAAKLFMQIVREEIFDTRQFQRRLELAKGSNEKGAFQKVLDDIAILKQYCCEHKDDEVIKGLYAQAKKVFLESSHVNESFNKEFIPQIQRALMEPYAPSHELIT